MVTLRNQDKKTLGFRAVDLFCGAGGSSWGAQLAGAEIVAGFDMWNVAVKAYGDHFPKALCYEERLDALDLKSIANEVGDIDLMLASPECTNHSPAKGGGTRSEESKDTALQVIRYAEALSPRWIIIENVVSMRRWSRYPDFLLDLRQLGYHTRIQTLDAKEFGVPQSRRRLFIMCDSEGKPSEVTPPRRTAKNADYAVNLNGRYSFSPLRTKRRAKATLARANRAIKALGGNQPFLLVYYSSDHAGGWQRLDAPLRTITTLDRFALVKPTEDGHAMRMLQPEELRKAMGMPAHFVETCGTRRDKIKLIGNGVCPPVMKRVVEVITTGDSTHE